MTYHKESAESIQSLFQSISPNYDRANAILSLGCHFLWNRSLVKTVGKSPGHVYLDLCAGTGEIAFQVLKREPRIHATLLDFCQGMLDVADLKGKALQPRFTTLCADAQKIPLPSQSVDTISMAYGIRNIPSPPLCFQESLRVLRPGGSFAILELTRPNSSFLRLGHSLYLKTMLPLLGKLITGNKQAYAYLSKSISQFVSPTTLQSQLQETGFKQVEIKPLMGGIATLIVCKK